MARTIRLLSGKSMPLMGFGTFKITGYDNVYKSLDVALKSGYRLIDTAQYYDNEADIGRALQELLPKHNLKREEIFITSKLRPDNMSLEKARPAVERSLRDLQCEYLDLFLVHVPRSGFPDNGDPEKAKQYRRESWQTLEAFQRDGKLHSIGVSNYEIRHIDEMNDYAQIKPSVNQCEFHPHYCRRDLVDDCKKRNVHFQAFTSLGRNDPGLMKDPVLIELASKYNATVSQILLAWPMHYDISVLPKSVTPERIQQNFQSINIRLSQEDADNVWRLHKMVNYTMLRPWEIV